MQFDHEPIPPGRHLLLPTRPKASTNFQKNSLSFDRVRQPPKTPSPEPRDGPEPAPLWEPKARANPSFLGRGAGLQAPDGGAHGLRGHFHHDHPWLHTVPEMGKWMGMGSRENPELFFQ